METSTFHSGTRVLLWGWCRCPTTLGFYQRCFSFRSNIIIEENTKTVGLASWKILTSSMTDLPTVK
jgi:hypothetical protein